MKGYPHGARPLLTWIRVSVRLRRDPQVREILDAEPWCYHRHAIRSLVARRWSEADACCVIKLGLPRPLAIPPSSTMVRGYAT